MIEPTGRSTDIIMGSSTTQQCRTHPRVNTDAALLAEQPDGNVAQKHTSMDIAINSATFQGKRPLRGAIQNMTTGSTRNSKPVCKTTEENTTTSLFQKPTPNRLSALYHKRMSSGGGSTKGHGKAHSATTLNASYKNEFDNELSLRKTRSAVYSTHPNQEMKQQTDENRARKTVQSQYFGRREQQTLGSTFDQSRLNHQLLMTLALEPFTNREFLPRGELKRLVTQESVDHELSKMEYLPTKIKRRTWRPATYPWIELPSESEITRRAHTKLDHVTTPQSNIACYQQVFAILLLMRRAKMIWSFVKERVCDADLPLSKIHQDLFFQLQRRGDAQFPLSCLKTSSDVSAFVTYQWYVLAPVFDGSHYKALKGQIMPFTRWENMNRRGGSGEVYKAKIHPDHYTFDKNEVHENVVAVKKMFRKRDGALNYELEVLQNLRKKQNAPTHLTPLLASYEQNEYLYLILPWAEVDLDQYWRSTRPISSGGNATWLKQQCCGITEAVAWIHRYHTTSGTTMPYGSNSSTPKARDDQNHSRSHQPLGYRSSKILFGRHGDIKPANILWFPDRTPAKGHGKLKICDFGTARFSDDENASVRNKDTVPNSRPYRSPECQLSGANISSQCDVWALGCVFLEFLCWYFGGRKLLEEFEHAREYGHESSSFFSFSREEIQMSAQLKQPVIEMMARLEKDSVSNSDLLDVLKTIENGMLVIMGDNKRYRKSAGNIARDLGSVLPPLHELRGERSEMT